MSSARISVRHAALALLAAAAVLGCASQQIAPTAGETVEIGPSDELRIPFLARAPVIDGILDAEVAALPVIPLPLFDDEGGAASASPVYARIAYCADSFYVCIESVQDRIQCRDRAYQQGDGIVLALASAREGDVATDEFQVLGFSPQAAGRRSWQYAFTWYKDRDWVGFPPLEGATFAWTHSEGTARYEILLPWSTVAPYHPWFRPEIGLNICYTRAAGSEGTISYRLVADRLLMYEVSPRLYRRVSFEAPALDGAMTCGVSLEASHALAGDPIVLRVATQGAGKAVLSTRIRQGRKVLGESRVTAKAAARLTVVDAPLDTAGLAPGQYDLEVVDADGCVRNLPFGILPDLDPAALHADIEAAGGRLPEGSLSTVEFRIQEIEQGLARLGSHSLGTVLGGDMAALARDVEAIRRGEDSLAGQTGIVRRAFRSKIDGTLQPYSIRPVASPKPGRMYPVAVFLHGSASDDRGQLDSFRKLLPGFILVAPYARGTSHFYTTDEAQQDIEEVLADVAAHYPVDPERIFLSGFSMGGYGVYRTYFEHPERYRGLVVLSGLPTAYDSAPDFRDPALLARFKSVEMFVVHGTEDRNCPFAETEQLVARLREAGARVEFIVQPGRGHEGPTLWNAARMLGWITRMAKK
jgi:predicted esterase